MPRNVFCRLRTALLAATLDAATVTAAAVGPLPDQPMMHLDAGYDYQPCRQAVLPPTGPKAWLACGRRSRPWIH